MRGRRVAILDGAHSLSGKALPAPSTEAPKLGTSQPATPKLAAKAKPSPSPLKGKHEEKITDVAIGPNKTAGRENSELSILKPIPNFSEIVKEAVQEAMRSIFSSGGQPHPAGALSPGIMPASSLGPTPTIVLPSSPSNPRATLNHVHIAQLDVGLICDVDVVSHLAARLHSGILRALSPASDSG